MVVEPDQIRYPIGVRVSADHDVVSDVVGVQCVEGAVAIFD